MSRHDFKDDLSFPNSDVKAQVAFANQFSTAKVGLVGPRRNDTEITGIAGLPPL